MLAKDFQDTYMAAKKLAEQASKSLRRMGDFLDAPMQNVEWIPSDLLLRDATDAYIAALKFAQNMQRFFESERKEYGVRICEFHENFDAIILPKAEIHDVTGTVSCTIFAPPTTKKRAANRIYLDLMYQALSQKIIEILPKNFTKMTSVDIIYVNHFQKFLQEKQPYFDNDNLAIKGLLDVVVPLLCVDDAYVYCDNFYVAQPDSENFAELIVVPKGRLLMWAQSRLDLDFAKELVAK